MSRFKIKMGFHLTLTLKPSDLDGKQADEVKEQFLDPEPYFDTSNFEQFGASDITTKYNCINLGEDKDLYSRMLEVEINGTADPMDELLEYLANADILDGPSDPDSFNPKEFWFNCLEDCDVVFHPETDENLGEDAAENMIEGSLEIAE